MEYNNHTYVVKEKAEDIRDSVIEKSNIKVDFTIAHYERNIADTEKTVKELKAKLNHEKLMKENIEEHHAYVKDLTAEQLHVIPQYVEACEVVRQYEPRIAEFETALAEDKAEMEVVMKMLNE